MSSIVIPDSPEELSDELPASEASMLLAGELLLLLLSEGSGWLLGVCRTLLRDLRFISIASKSSGSMLAATGGRRSLAGLCT